MMLFKIGMAIIISLLAAIIAVIAGLVAGIRTGTVFLRAVLIFAVSGFGLTFAIFWIEKYGIPLYMAKKKDEQSEWLKLYLMLKEMDKKDEQAEDSEPGVNTDETEEQPLVDVSVSDKMTLGALTEEEIASLNEDTGESDEEELSSTADEGLEEHDSGGQMEEPLPEEETVMAEETPEFAPLSVENMTRMKIPDEDA